jgi:hypothetical protein
VWSTKTVVAWICSRTSNMINNWTHSWQILGWWYSAWWAQAKIWEALHSNQFHLFCYGVGTVYTITTKASKQCALWEWVILLSTRWYTTTLPSRRQKLPQCNDTNQCIGQMGQCWSRSPNSSPSTFTSGSPLRMWYIIEHWHWRHYRKKLKHHVPLSQWTPWSRLLVH